MNKNLKENVFIKDFNRLMHSTVKTKNDHKKHFCMSCLQNFTTEEILNNHRERCLLNNETQAVKYETEIIKVKSHNKQRPTPFKIYADIECSLKRININEDRYTKLYQEHIPNSIGAKLVCIYDEFTLPTKLFTGNNCIKEFIEWIFKQQKNCNQIINKKFNKNFRMTLENENNYRNSKDFCICNLKIKDEDKVRYLCYLTNKYKGHAHKECSKILRKLPVIFHNLEGYDGHIIFKELNNFDNIDIQVIPKANEKYMSIIINNSIVFLDSLQFCKASLDTLAGNLKDKDFKHLISEFSKDKLEILKRKDSYPYEWVDSYEKFNYEELPPKEVFYSSIDDGKRGKGDGHISDEQYLHLKNVWNTFNFKPFKDYHNHYLKNDVFLLADGFEKFIFTCLEYYNLDPCHYFSAPGLSWDAMLKMTKVELEKISNADMHLFIERGMRGGISYVNKTYGKANNEFCPDYDKTKPNVCIKYLDMNNLYGQEMSEYLPYGGFKWIKINNETINRVLNKSGNSLHGYFLEVDLELPEKEHDKHNDYPLAPKKIKVKEEMLSPYQLEIKNKYDIKVGITNNLIPNLLSKEKYVVHYRDLKYYLSKGLILTEVHRVLEFKQSAWMKP